MRAEPPPYVEALAVYGWAVQHGGIPLAYAVEILAEHGLLTLTHPGDDTQAERRAVAREQLVEWEDVLVESEWPGDEAIDQERWDQPADWHLREEVQRDLYKANLPFEEHESTDVLLARYARFRAAQCRAKARMRKDPPPAPSGKA